MSVIIEVFLKDYQKKNHFFSYFLEPDFKSFSAFIEFFIAEPSKIICEEKYRLWSELIPDDIRFR